MQGAVVVPGDETYDHARRIWNGAVDRRPALFALCETVHDVQAAVRVSRTHGLALSVRGGGHDWAGRALRHGGLVIDLTRMRQVTVDARARIATVGGGSTAHDLMTAAAPHGLAAVTGNVGAVGMAGFLLAGGYGPLTTRFGLALDNLLALKLFSPTVGSLRPMRRKTPTCSGLFAAVAVTLARLHRCVFASIPSAKSWPASSCSPGPRRNRCCGVTRRSSLRHRMNSPCSQDWSRCRTAIRLSSLAPSGAANLRAAEIMSQLQSLCTPILTQIGPMRYTDLLPALRCAGAGGPPLRGSRRAGWLISRPASSPP